MLQTLKLLLCHGPLVIRLSVLPEKHTRVERCNAPTGLSDLLLAFTVAVLLLWDKELYLVEAIRV